MAASSFAMSKAVGHQRQVALQPARTPTLKSSAAPRTRVSVNAHQRNDEAGLVSQIGQSVLTAALVASFGMGMSAPAFANPEDNMTPSEKRAAAAERRREILRATREKAEQNAASLEEKGEADTEASAEAAPEAIPESTASKVEMATDLKAMLRDYQSAPPPAAAPAPAPEPKAPEPEKPKPSFSFSRPKAATPAPEPEAPPAPEPKAPEPEPEKPKPSFSFSAPKLAAPGPPPTPPPPPVRAPEPKPAPAATSKSDLLNMLDTPTPKSAPKAAEVQKQETKKQDAKKQDNKKDSKKKNKRKGPLPPFLAEAVMGGLIYGTFLAGTKYEKETEEATKALGSFVKKNLK